jgi:hypothetical protein
MRPHAIALIKRQAHDAPMELLIALVLLAIIGVLAQAAGTDSRNADPRSNQPAW